MAKVNDAECGLAGLATATWQAGTKLWKGIQSQQPQPHGVVVLANENKELNRVLSLLQKRLASSPDDGLSVLELPLRRCKYACVNVELEIGKLSSKSRDNLTRSLDWQRVQYMGENMDDFRHLLAGYRMTISIALADATLRTSNVTDKKMDRYSLLLQAATSALESRLESIEAAQRRLVGQDRAGPDEATAALAMKNLADERLSMENCLEICSKFSEHINRLQPGGESCPAVEPDSASTSDSIGYDGMEEGRDSLLGLAEQLEEHEEKLFQRLLSQMRAPSLSAKEATEVLRLREEWESTHQAVGILFKAGRRREKVSVIENHGTGDALQFMVSADGQPLRGINRSTGWRSRQFGGCMDNLTIRQLSSDAVRMVTTVGHEMEASMEETATRGKAKGADDGSDENSEESSEDGEFEGRHGSGRRLESESESAPAAETRRRQMSGRK